MLIQKVSERFFTAIENLAAETKVEMKKAHALAEKEHEGQLRKEHKARPDDRDPYLIHPMRVSLILMNELKIADHTALVSAVLHDVVEDGNSRPTVEDIRMQFGDEIARTVQYLTKPEEKDGEKHTPEDLLPYHNSFYTAPLHVRLVKLSDRLDNLRETLLVDRPKFQHRYLHETRDVYLPLAAQTSFFFTEQLSDLCNRLESMLS